jgi:hypothetical protein
MAEIQRIPRTLADNEAVIKRGMLQVWEVAAALADIREQKQYLEAGYKTFEAYCQERWNFGRDYATSLMRGAKVLENIKQNVNKEVDKTLTTVSVLPETEWQARAIHEATKQPEEQAKVWEQAVEDAGGEQPTAPQIKRAAEKVKAAKEPEPEEASPEPAKICDEFGPLDVSLIPLWSDLATIREALNAVRALKKRFKELLSVEVGSRIVMNPVDAAIKAMEQALKYGVPYTECFKCQRKRQHDCRLCRGSGWITQSEYSGNRTEAADRWLKGRQ